MGLSFPFPTTKQKKHLEIYIFSIFSRRKILEYTTLALLNNFRLLFPLFICPECAQVRERDFFLVLCQKNCGLTEQPGLLQGAPCWSSNVNPVSPHEGENNFDSTMKTIPSILRFSKLLSSNILFPFLPFSSISQYGIGLRYWKKWHIFSTWKILPSKCPWIFWYCYRLDCQHRNNFGYVCKAWADQASANSPGIPFEPLCLHCGVTPSHLSGSWGCLNPHCSGIVPLSVIWSCVELFI